MEGSFTVGAIKPMYSRHLLHYRDRGLVSYIIALRDEQNGAGFVTHAALYRPC